MRLSRWTGAALLASIACSEGPTNSLGGPLNLNVEVLLGGNGVSDLLQVGGVTYAVGHRGLVMRGADGGQWTTERPRTTLHLRGLAHSGTQYVAVGGNESDLVGGRVLTSPDGFNWQERDIAVPTALLDATWTGTQFVAVGVNSVIATSPDGITWTQRNQGPGIVMRSVAASGERIVVVGHDVVAYYVLTSTDGINWTVALTGGGELNAVRWIDNEFVAVGNTILRSGNGTNWQQSPVPDVTFTDLAHGTGVYVAVTANGALYSSPDAASWTQRDSLGEAATSIVWTGSQFTTCGTGGVCATSPDGITWTRRFSPPAIYLQSIARSTFRYVAAGIHGYVLTSEDGLSWTSRPTPTTETITNVVWSGTQFVAVTDGWDGIHQTGGKSLVSTDGVSWTVHPTGAPVNLNAVAYAAPLGKYIAVGGEGAILGSSDGQLWTAEASGTDATLSDVIWLGTRFVVAAEAPFMFRSVSTRWERVNPTTEFLSYRRLAHGPNAIVVLALGLAPETRVRTFTSSNALEWSEAGHPPELGALTWTGTRFVHIWGNGGQTSSDGYQWTDLVLDVSEPVYLYDAIQVGPDLTVVGSHGSIWRIR